MAVATIANKLYQRKRAKDKVKRATKLSAAEATRIQSEIDKAQAALQSKGAPLPASLVPLTAGAPAGAPRGAGLLLPIVALGALVLLTRKARR
jgi:hypothetical protein